MARDFEIGGEGVDDEDVLQWVALTRQEDLARRRGSLAKKRQSFTLRSCVASFYGNRIAVQDRIAVQNRVAVKDRIAGTKNQGVDYGH